LRGTDLFGPLVTGFDRFAYDEIKYVHEERCSMDGLRLEKSTYRVSTPYRTVGESVTYDNIAEICNQKSTSNQHAKFAGGWSATLT
jgi:hypothetical protein